MSSIKEIAALAGVSMTTVSKVLNNAPNFSVSERTRQNIIKISEQLGYKLDKIEQARVNQKLQGKRIALLSATNEQEEISDPFWAIIRSKLEAHCLALGFESFQLMRRRQVNPEEFKSLDGLFVLGTIDLDQVVSRLREHTHVVLIDHTYPIFEFDRVSIDFNAAADKVVQHFIEGGHSHIGFIGGRQHLDQLNTKEAALVLDEPLRTRFKERMREHKLYNGNFYRETDWSTESGYTAMNDLLKLEVRPTAVFIANDQMAVGALKALHERDVKVPDEMAIVGFNNNSDLTAFLPIPLSTFNVFHDEIGKAAATMMFERMLGREANIHTIIQPKFIARDSG